MGKKILLSVMTSVLLASATSNATELTWTLDNNDVNEIEIGLEREFTVQLSASDHLSYGTKWVGPSDGNDYEEGDAAKIIDIVILPSAGPDAAVQNPAGTGYPGWWTVLGQDYDPENPPNMASGPHFDVTIKAMTLGTESFTSDFYDSCDVLVVNVLSGRIVGYIDWIDVEVFADSWLNKDCNDSNDWCGGADLDRNTEVDLIDFSWLAQYWLETAPAPNAAYSPAPNDTATNIDITADLSWMSGVDVICDAVYFGTNSTPDTSDFKGYQTTTKFDLGVMDTNTTYYWRIDEVGIGQTTTGDIWSFTTIPAPK